jgi:transcription initiation factor TFIID TATA-box-binding protein
MRKRKYSSLPCFHGRVLEDGQPLPVVHNIVATSQILSSLKMLDLNRIHSMLPFSFYDQAKFAAITVRLHEPDCTTLLFSSGKLVVTGCRTWYECVYASLFVADLLRECIPGHSFALGACDVQNMVAHVEIPVGNGCLDLHGMYAHLALNCTYQRKMFPGLIYRPEASPVVLLCFFSGKIVITGGKTMEDVYSGWSRLWPTLQGFITSESVEQPLSNAQPGQRRGSKRPMQLANRREIQKGLPLERHAVAGHAGGLPDALEEAARGGCGGAQVLDLPDPPELQGLCDDLAAECRSPLLGIGLAAAHRPGEPGAPHAAVVEHEPLVGDGSAELQGGVVLLGGD